LPDKKYKDLYLNGTVTITVPVAVAIGFISEYQGAPWSGADANNVLAEFLRQVLDPLYLNTVEAHLSAQNEQQQAIQQRMMSAILGGDALPGFPPEASEQ